MRQTLWLLTLSCTVGVHPMFGQESASIRIAPLGETVALEIETPFEDQYVLETQARLATGERWAPLMQFRGNTDGSRRFVDPICGDKDAKFFRLRRLLDAPPREVSNFRLLDLEGNAHELYYHWPAKGVILLLAGAEPQNILTWSQSLRDIQTRFGEDELLVWPILLSSLDERDDLQASLSNLPASMPILQDTSHAVTRTLSTGEGPEAVLIDPENWSIAYRGPVELVVETGSSTEAWAPLAEAVSELMSGKRPAVSRLAPLGESLGLIEVKAASYTETVAPLLQQHCFPCHTPGNIAPWAMTSHGVIEEFSGLIKSAVLAGEMPPWHADPKYSAFSNSKSMSSEEVSLLVDWIDRGAPRGEGPDPLESDPLPERSDWPLGQPDAIITIDSQTVPAQGSVDYRYLFAESPFPNDVWLKAAAVKPGNRSVVHHCLVFKGNFLELLAMRGGLSGFFTGYVPGMESAEFPEGTGKRLKKRDILLLQMHYTVNGRVATDRTQVGLYLADAPPEKELITSSAYDVDLRIPPRTRDVHVKAVQRFPNDSTLYEFSPHMHYRGARAKYTLQYPDGTDEVILSVPAYFFDWQAFYRLEQPKSIPAGTRLLCEGWFDNTAQNPFNPDPNDTVRFGQQSWEEMFIGYVNYSED